MPSSSSRRKRRPSPPLDFSFHLMEKNTQGSGSSDGFTGAIISGPIGALFTNAGEYGFHALTAPSPPKKIRRRKPGPRSS